MANLYMLIGIPASGKSTYAHMYMSDMAYVCPDEVRKELYGDISIQGNGKEVFAIVNDRIKSALSGGEDVVYDATNTSQFRASDIEKFRNFGASHVYGYYIHTPLEVALKRNQIRADRAKPVPEEVIRSMFERLEANPPSFDDGFDCLHIVEYA